MNGEYPGDDESGKAQTRRRLVLGAAITATLGAAGALSSGGAARARSASDINNSVANALRDLYRSHPEARRIAADSHGALVMPDILKAGFVLGAAYGEGALIKGGRTHSYWKYTAGSVGWQAGGQRTRMAIFFMSKKSLRRFLTGDGVEMGLDAELTIIDGGADIGLDTTQDRYDVIVYTFGRAGLLGGASYTGGRYTRIDR